MHPQDRLQTEVAGLDHFAQVLLANPRQHGVGAAGHLETGLELAIDQFRLAEVETVIVAIDGQHGGHLIRVLFLMDGFCGGTGVLRSGWDGQ
ncbi:hypothetical protein D3C81_2041970 [compost metagenome]